MREISSELQQYNASKQKELLAKLLELKVPQLQKNALNEQLQASMLLAFKNIMMQEATHDLCSLLTVLFQALRNSAINKSVLITLLDNVLECVGISDLKQVLNVIRERIGELGNLQPKVSFNLMRIINTLLKRISRTTDFHVRGQLHLTITRIISFCHQSGFEYRPEPIQGNQKINVEDTFLQNFQQSNMNIQFYENFWQLQIYFLDLQQLGKPENNNSTPTKQDAKLIAIRLKRVEYILEDLLKYFKINPPTENKDFTTFPLKFLKLPNLLTLQLHDSYFRAVILLQAIFFCSSLKQFPAKYRIELTNQAKQTVNRIDKKINEYMQEIMNSRKDATNAISMINNFSKNQLNWIQLKDNWRQRKKTFFMNSHEEQLKKKDSITPSGNVAAPGHADHQVPSKKSQKTYNLIELTNKCKKDIQNKLEIWPKFINNFLKHTQAPVLKKQPIVPSFSYYYSQARKCLETFDQIQLCQTQFDSRLQYNLFEWKAFRSLQRQRIIKNKDSDKNANKLADYKLLDFIKRNQEVLQGEPRKRTKTEQNQQERQQ